MNKTIIAIDPGASGGIAVQFDGGKVDAYPMEQTEGDILSDLKDVLEHANLYGGEAIAVVEEVGGFIAGNPAPGSAMFNFGRSFGFLLGCLMALGFRVELIRPQKWQKALSLGSRRACGSSGEWKRKLKAEAQRLYPHLKVTLKTADALMILEAYKKLTLHSSGGILAPDKLASDRNETPTRDCETAEAGNFSEDDK